MKPLNSTLRSTTTVLFLALPSGIFRHQKLSAAACNRLPSRPVLPAGITRALFSARLRHPNAVDGRKWERDLGNFVVCRCPVARPSMSPSGDGGSRRPPAPPPPEPAIKATGCRVPDISSPAAADSKVCAECGESGAAVISSRSARGCTRAGTGWSSDTARLYRGRSAIYGLAGLLIDKIKSKLQKPTHLSFRS